MEKVKALKTILFREKVDGYLVPKNDEFFGEYISKQRDRLQYISKFSGSYGLSLILKDKNYLFVDGRYSLQAEKQSGKFFKVITFPNKMPHDVIKNKKLLIGFDPTIFTSKTINIFFKKCKCKFKPLENNLIDEIWKRKLEKSKNKFFSLPPNSVGENYKSKINRVVKKLYERNADFQFITSSENNAWLLNIRGKDSKFTPIPHCHMLISKSKKIFLFCDQSKISGSMRKKLGKIKFLNIDRLTNFLQSIKNKKFIIDSNTCSFFYEKLILKNNKILNFEDPIYLFKSIKTRKEIQNIKKAHISDGVALTKYLLWLKKNFPNKNITELSAEKKLLYFRKKNNDFLFSSFPTISGTGPNGAIIHYKATKKSNRKLKKGEIYLVDSGGQYKFGTTDVTRTISLKNKNNRVKNIFTRVLKGHIAVTNFNLNKNTSGSKLDNIARKYLKKINLDYSHGTGHGVGYFLNVHEGPQSISKNNKVPLLEGMVVSNEPGYYEKNNFGIRIENLIYVKRSNKKIFFENLTMAPIDKELIDTSLLKYNEKKWINSYHKKVFNSLKNKMNKLELVDLKKSCSAI